MRRLLQRLSSGPRAALLLPFCPLHPIPWVVRHPCRCVSGSITSTSTITATSTKPSRPHPLPSEHLRRRVGTLVKAQDAAGAVRAVQDSLQDGVFSSDALSAALYCCDATSNHALGLDLMTAVRAMQPQSAWATEPVLASVLRLQCASGDLDAAMQLMTYVVQQKLLRVRTASIFIEACAASPTPRRDWAMGMYQECLRAGLELQAKDYIHLGKLCLATGREPMDTLHFMLQEMREHVAEVPAAMVAEVLEPWVAASPSPASASVAGTRTPTLTRTTIPRSTGVCPVCQTRLGGYPFTAAYRAQLLEDLAARVVPAKCTTARAKRGFEAWSRYIMERQRTDPVTVLIDGANVGYYGLSSWYHLAKRAKMERLGAPPAAITEAALDFNANAKHGAGGVDVGVNYELIQLALDAARAAGLAPLVLLHERHTELHNTTEAERATLQRWWQERCVYSTPSGLNDDLCWLYAALALTTPTDVITSPHDGSAAAPTVYVLSNDCMRDHHFSLLSPRYFSRWRERHQVRFCCARVDERTVLRLQMPSPFTRCIQELAPRQWHIPHLGEDRQQEGEDTVRDREEWVCLR